MAAATASGMIAKRFEELICWQRMHELSIEVWKVTDRPPASKDFDFRDEIDTLANRGLQAVAKFQRYLRSPEARRNAARRYRKQPRVQNDSNDPNDPNDPNEKNDSNDPNVTNDPNAPE